MKTQLKQLFSMALCCTPMLVVPLLVSVAGALGWRMGVFGLALTILAALACPISMGLMLWRMTRHSKMSTTTPTTAMPTEAPEHSEGKAPSLTAAQTK